MDIHWWTHNCRLCGFRAHQGRDYHANTLLQTVPGVGGHQSFTGSGGLDFGCVRIADLGGDHGLVRLCGFLFWIILALVFGE